MAKEVKLLGFWASAYVVRVQIALNFKGIEYEYVEEDLKKKSELLLQSNPVYRQVPVLVHGGKPIPESMVILEYIEEAWPEKPLLPQDPYQRAMAPTFKNKIYRSRSSPFQCLPSGVKYFTTKGEDQLKAKEELVENLRILEGALQGNKFFAGETAGMVDIVAGWLPFWIRRMEGLFGDKVVEEDNLPHLNAWFQDYLSLPFVREKLPPPDKVCAHLRGLLASLEPN
ncbi:Glutathione transferase GST 23 [Nymphaea thermarum]|nr:Glutathione transferase GST 23 [Nymphaea thermarum]